MIHKIIFCFKFDLPCAGCPTVILVLARLYTLIIHTMFDVTYFNRASKIGELAYKIMSDDHIGRLEIHVHNPMQMYIFKRLDQVKTHAFSLRYSQLDVTVNKKLTQIYASTKLINKKGVLGQQIALVESKLTN